MIPFADFRAEYLSLQTELQHALESVFESGSYILGENVKAFEAEFAAYVNVPFAVGVGSGTEALHLSLLACGIGPGDEVITVPNTSAPTAMAISASGARPVFVDVDPEFYTLDANRLEQAFTPAVKAIIPVHLYGQTADMDPILEMARRYNLVVIEDACQAHGAEYRGRKAGSMGHLGCFSFYPTKNLGAYGDGGMVVTSDPSLYEKLKLLRNLGQTDRYHHQIRGYNSRLDEIQAAVLRVKLQHLEEWNERRRRLAANYERRLENARVAVPRQRNDARAVFHLYVIRSYERDGLADTLKSKGVTTLIHYPIPLHRQEAYRDLGLPEGTFPVAERLAHEVLSLPLYPQMKEEDIAFIASVIVSY